MCAVRDPVHVFVGKGNDCVWVVYMLARVMIVYLLAVCVNYVHIGNGRAYVYIKVCMDLHACVADCKRANFCESNK